MALSESSRNALLPAFLYASPATAGGVGGRAVAAPSAAGPAVWARAPSEPGRRIEMYSPAFYAACTAGGIASCGLTHMTVTPLDLVKCNMQVRGTIRCEREPRGSSLVLPDDSNG